MTVKLELLRTSPTTALTKSYLAEAALQLLHEQDKAIAAAVAAEREACAKVAETKRAVGTSAEIACAMYHAEHIAAAIRARNGAK